MKQDIMATSPQGDDYNLPVCDTQSERRNFPGYAMHGELDWKDISEPGNTGEDYTGKRRYTVSEGDKKAAAGKPR